MLRIFRILKLVKYIGEVNLLVKALVSSKRKIFIFLFIIFNVVIILGSIMYLIEGEKAGYSSIPRSIYWAIVTLTTVGYGDIAPITSLGQTIAAIIMLLGYSIIAVPTGIITSELTSHKKRNVVIISCPVCEKDNLDSDSFFCNKCGFKVDS
ncbi:MAG: potassium channel family protein [Candidatus Neomarinimicrobiota bacterium]